MSDAPERIGLVASPFGYALWNSHYHDDSIIAINYVRADLHEALVKERDDACRYLESWLVSFCSQHFPENTNWRPLTGDLIGMLTQADNAGVIARDLRKERDTLAADKAELLAALERAWFYCDPFAIPDSDVSLIEAALARHAAPAEVKHADDCTWNKTRKMLKRRCSCGAIAPAKGEV